MNLLEADGALQAWIRGEVNGHLDWKRVLRPRHAADHVIAFAKEERDDLVIPCFAIPTKTWPASSPYRERRKPIPSCETPIP
jgi:hypothetical protein